MEVALDERGYVFQFAESARVRDRAAQIAAILNAKVRAAAGIALLTAGALQAATPGRDNAETATRAQIAAATFEDTLVVDCQLPGRLQQLGGMRTYLTPGALTRLPAIDCRIRGGEYTIGNLASGPLSLKRWLPLAEKDNVEAQYYVARIYANAMDGVPANYAEAARWYQRAAQKKYAPAMQELGYLYEQGLGVPKDTLNGLNLQRAASGLGDDLVYASTLEASEQQSQLKIAALTDQLAAVSNNLQTLQQQLGEADDKLAQDDAEIARDRARLGELRTRLDRAQRESANGDATRARQIQEQLASAETELKQKQQAVESLSAELQLRRAQLAAQLADSQTANSKLNDLLAASKSESETLRSKLAQSEQRALQSQQELSELRTRFVQETSELAARSAELTQLRQRDGQGLQAVLQARQAQIEQQQRLVETLQGQIATLKQQLGASASGSGELQARNRDLEATLAALRVQYEQQQHELQTQRTELSQLQSQSKENQAAAVAQLSAQLAAKTATLQDQQKRIDSLQLETRQLREAYDQELTQRTRDAAGAASQVQQDQLALRAAQEQLAQQREALQQLQLQSAAQQLKLVQERQAPSAQLASGQQADQQKIAALEADLRDRDKQIADARAHLSALEQQQAAAKPASGASAVSYRMPEVSSGGSIGPNNVLELVRHMGPANYHALVIGNSNYRYLPALKTPANDAQEIAKLLEGRYGFDVKLLVDASRQQIGQAMYEYQHTLTDADRLLIYYAGHGGSKDLPPQRAYWQGIDSSADDQSTWMSAIDVGEFIAQIHARHVLLVSDSCFSGVITHPTSTIVAPSNDERSVRIKWSRAARMVLTSGQDEPVVDSSGPNPNHSLFADQFLTVLRQNTILLSGEMLAHEISERIAVTAARIGVKQSPSYSNLQDKQHMFGDFFFVPVVGSAEVALVPH